MSMENSKANPPMDPENPSAAGAVSFGFSNVRPPKSKVILSSAAKFFSIKEAEAEVDFEKEVSERGTLVKEVRQDIVIPCQGNRINFKSGLTKAELLQKLKKEDGSAVHRDDLVNHAAQEILNDAEKWKKDQENVMDEKKTSVEIPLSEDLAMRAEQSTLEDYESVPVEGFGLGMLRGMGFKHAEGIGGFKKAVVKCIEPVMRPNRLGLGAARPQGREPKKKTKKRQRDHDDHDERKRAKTLESSKLSE